MLREIGLIFLLLIICIILLSIISPIIDEIFSLDNELEKTSNLKILYMVIIHIFIVGVLILIIHYFLITDYLKYFKLLKHERYTKLFIDLIITLTLTGLQKNLLTKIRYLSSKHPIRS